MSSWGEPRSQTEDRAEEVRQAVAPLRWPALLVGIVAGALLVVGYFVDRQQVFVSYLFGYLFWLGIALGSLAITMLHDLTGGAWGVAIRRILEAATGTLPLLALLFLPLLLGMEELYVWARPDVVEHDPILQAKQRYLNVPFFLVRAAAYFVIWIGLAWLVNYWSNIPDPQRALPRRRKLQLLGGPGLVLYGLSVTFAAVDWVMSLEPHWYSSMFGVLLAGGQVLSALTFATLVLIRLRDRHPVDEGFHIERMHDLGKLMLAFVMFWTYIAFMQFLIIWSGNLPEEATWYLHRLKGGWEWLALALLVLHFFVPFLLLLSRHLKRTPASLQWIAVLVLAMRPVDLFWLVAPSFSPSNIRLHWLNLVAPLAVGGFWLALFAWRLPARAALPIRYFELEEETTHEHPASRQLTT